jgi:hypothetical protein
MRVYKICAVLFTVGIILLFTGVFTASYPSALTEDVYEFGDWYGVAYCLDNKTINKEIVVFSHSNDASLTLSASDKEVVISAGLQDVRTDRDVLIFIDEGEAIEALDSRLIRGFKKGRTAEIHFTDTNNRQRKELFSLDGFTKAYRWLSK